MQSNLKENNMSVFSDQAKFMEAGDQTVGHFNEVQFNLYLKLIEEEYGVELKEALEANDREEILDALLDTIVVVVGAIHSLGVDAEGAWNEVIRSNMSKVDKESGKLLKREDGKVLKPDTFSPVDLKPFIK
jgi:predicted HAD superfamily Cof-like phosphohydrolase